jgi:hypothetical protein
MGWRGHPTALLMVSSVSPPLPLVVIRSWSLWEMHLIIALSPDARLSYLRLGSQHLVPEWTRNEMQLHALVRRTRHCVSTANYHMAEKASWRRSPAGSGVESPLRLPIDVAQPARSLVLNDSGPSSLALEKRWKLPRLSPAVSDVTCSCVTPASHAF